MRISFVGCEGDNLTLQTDLGNVTQMCDGNQEIVIPSSINNFTINITSDKH
jgi:hypothetical protein